MPTYEKLKRNIDFARVYRRGKHRSGRYIVLHAYKRRDNEKDLASRVGFTVAKKVQGSVERNRMKRLLREAFRLSEFTLQNGYDLIVTARWRKREPEQKVLQAELYSLLKKMDLVQS